MRVKIYQINLDRDLEAIAFDSWQELQRHQEQPGINKNVYDQVWEGEVDANDLEDVFQIFNRRPRPEGFTGRSLSVSDIVTVIRSDSVEPGSYFVDSIGFKKVDGFE